MNDEVFWSLARERELWRDELDALIELLEWERMLIDIGGEGG